MTATKYCPRCAQDLDVALFHRNKARSDGLESMCKACKNQSFRDKYANNEEFRRYTKARTRNYHLTNPDWSYERLREHHVKNRAERLKRQQERLKDPAKRAKARESTRRSESRRRAMKMGAHAEFITQDELCAVLDEYSWCCYICSEDITKEGEKLHWDHFHPLAKGGTHTLTNLRPSCKLCNGYKSDRWPVSEDLLHDIKLESGRTRLRRAGMEVRAPWQ